jgi:hypothetical protein
MIEQPIQQNGPTGIRTQNQRIMRWSPGFWKFCGNTRPGRKLALFCSQIGRHATKPATLITAAISNFPCWLIG